MKIRKGLLIFLGTLFLVIGAAGILLPVVPTTPFLLLAALCYMKGSARLYRRLVSSKVLGSYIRNYMEGKGMSVAAKIWTLMLLWLAIAGTAVFLTDNLFVRVVLGGVAVGVTVHILKTKTRPEEFTNQGPIKNAIED